MMFREAEINQFVSSDVIFGRYTSLFGPLDCTDGFRNPFSYVTGKFSEIFQVRHTGELTPSVKLLVPKERVRMIVQSIQATSESENTISSDVADSPLINRSELDTKRIFDVCEHIDWALGQPHPLAEPPTPSAACLKFVEHRKRVLLSGADLDLFREQSRARWQQRADALEAERLQWRASLDPFEDAIIGHIHFPLLKEMVAASESVDTGFIDEFRNGFPLAGYIPPSNRWRTVDEPYDPSWVDWWPEGIEDPCLPPRIPKRSVLA